MASSSAPRHGRASVAFGSEAEVLPAGSADHPHYSLPGRQPTSACHLVSRRPHRPTGHPPRGGDGRRGARVWPRCSACRVGMSAAPAMTRQTRGSGAPIRVGRSRWVRRRRCPRRSPLVEDRRLRGDPAAPAPDDQQASGVDADSFPQVAPGGARRGLTTRAKRDSARRARKRRGVRTHTCRCAAGKRARHPPSQASSPTKCPGSIGHALHEIDTGRAASIQKPDVTSPCEVAVGMLSAQ
jgi:hypothetical protein